MKNRGFSLLEILISLLILSFGIMGMMAMQVNSIQLTKTALWQSIALTQAFSMLERLRANHASEIRTREFFQWEEGNQHWLPQGHGDYQCNADGCTVTVIWAVGSSKEKSR
ncbi:MAG: type IV pilus modification protein PilV [Coxiellaceae bacterium]|nr:MAG: type IV pilus modification protein PilV [Coxiellaceae bacterium]